MFKITKTQATNGEMVRDKAKISKKQLEKFHEAITNLDFIERVIECFWTITKGK